MNRLLKNTLLFLSFYYLLTGVWPIFSIGTFQMVTGGKTDLWLVRMVGLLAAVIGGTCLLFVIEDRRSPELLFLAIGSAVAFASIDIIYSLSGVISPIYLADAALQAVLILLLAVAWRR